jgi:hypothetical protein
LVLAGTVDTVSKLFQVDAKLSESQIAQGYFNEYLASNREEVARWGLDAQGADNAIRLAKLAREGR